MSHTYLFLILLILVICLHSYNNIFSRQSGGNDAKQLKNYIIQTLIRQIGRWSIASTQDKNAIIKMMHACYGTGYLMALKSIGNSSEIEDITDVNVEWLTNQVYHIQDNATMYLAKECPQIVPQDKNIKRLAEVAGYN